LKSSASAEDFLDTGISNSTYVFKTVFTISESCPLPITFFLYFTRDIKLWTGMIGGT
jgi:hypothetical protein